MKTFLMLTLISLALPVAVRADTLTAQLLSGVIRRIEGARFVGIGHGLLFGHDSIESCGYVSAGLLVLDEYCYPAKDYPARALLLWSREFGEIELYEQQLGPSLTKRDVRLNQFPELVRNLFSFSFPGLDFATINSVSAKLYNEANPACWSSNYDPGTGAPVMGCYKVDPADFPRWADEAGRLVSGNGWDSAFTRIRNAVKARD